MTFHQQEASGKISNLVKSFWEIEDEQARIERKEKIIPDGYPEVIFHYGDPFRSKIDGTWKTQQKDIIAGQIRNYFYLANTGRIGLFGIKFQPWALCWLFGIDMSTLTDKAETLNNQMLAGLLPVKQIVLGSKSFQEKVAAIEQWFCKRMDLEDEEDSKGMLAVKWIIEKKGLVRLDVLRDELDVGEKALERYFKKYIGLSPKFYARIIRFSHIFQLVQKEDFKWAGISYQAGFYDQSHFIKNFKEFTGEDPSSYGFDEKNMANFFLKK